MIHSMIPNSLTISSPCPLANPNFINSSMPILTKPSYLKSRILNLTSAISSALSFWLIAVVGFIALAQTSWGQTTIFSVPGGGALPSGWTGTNNVATNVIDLTSYYLVDAGNPSDFITTGDYDLSSYTSLTLNVKVATYGNGFNPALRVQISTASGAFTSAATYTSASPTSSTYITGGPITITGPFTSTTKLRFSNTLTSGKGVRIQSLVLTGVAPTATIIGAATANAFTTTYGTPSDAQTFSVSGANMTTNLIATAPTGFEVASDGVTYGGTATFTQSGGAASGTLSVRLKASAAVAGTYHSQNIVLSTTGGTSVNIVTAASGNIVTTKGLSITASAQTKTYGSTLALGTSLFSSIGLANSEIIGSVTLTSTGSAASAAAGGYTITPSAATGSTFTASNYSITYNTGTLTVDPKALTITAFAATKAFGDTLASPVTGSSAFSSIGLAGTETIGSVTITYGTGAASGDAAAVYADQVTPSLAVGGTFDIANYVLTYVAASLTVTADPTISLSGTLAAVDTTYGTPSATPTSFSVSGIFLTGDLTVTPPAGFEVSTTIGSGYNTSLNITASGTLASTPVYVRLAAATAFGSYSGNITVAGGGATSKTVATVSSSVAKKALTITGLTGSNKPYDADLAASTTGTAAYSGLENSENFAVTGTASATFASAGAGLAKPITITGYTAPSDNYSVTQPTGLSADITPVALSITAPTLADKFYNGNATTGTLTVGTLSGFVGSETLTVTGAAAAYPSANAATYTGTVITYTLQNGSNGGLVANYSLANGTADGTIAPRTLTITANSVFKNVGVTVTGGAGSTAFTTSGGPISPETVGSVTITYGTGAAAGDAVGTYLAQVTPSAATGGTFTASNYNITYVPGDITVTVPLIAGWDFQTTTNGGTAAAAAPGSPTTYTANFGTGTIYLDGSFTSSAWTSLASSPQLTSFGGTAVNAATGFSTITSGASSLTLANSSANGQKIVFKFNMTGRGNLAVSYAAYGSATGFSSHLWEYSTDGTTWSTAETIGSFTTSYATKTLAALTALNGATNAYLRLTVSGATATSGNNRLDNIQVRAADIPTIYSVGSVAAFTSTFGSPSAAQTFAISGVNLGADITATAPTGFEVSADGTSYASTAIFTQSSGVASGSLRIRLADTATVSGSYNAQSIVLTSTGATTVNITTTVSGNVVSKATPTITTAPTASAITSGQTLASSSLTGGVASTAGAFAFTTPGTTPTVTANQDVTFTPTDTANYNNATTTVSVTVTGDTPDPLFTDITKNAVVSEPSAGVKRLSFTGIPGRVYGIQRSSTLTGWTQIGTVTASVDGAAIYNDTSPLLDKGFYRIIFPAE
jgi:hypothetical protein